MNTAIAKNVDDPQAFDHRFAAVNGIRLHYVEEGQGPLVILLHGYPFLWYLWRHQIKVLAAAGYRVVALDQRGYGQSDCPEDIDAYDITHLVGDVVGLIKALDSDSAVLVGQDWGSPVAYNTALMRPDLVRGVVMMCSPPSARGAIRPSDAMKAFQEKGIEFYQSYIARPEAGAEIMRDVGRFLLGLFYSTSGYCPADSNGGGPGRRPIPFPIPTRFRKRYRRISASRRWTTTSPNSRATASSPPTNGMPPLTPAGRVHHSSMGRRSGSPHSS
jgi:pimeloyl-ACP methyl ester carboxylesterase